MAQHETEGWLVHTSSPWFHKLASLSPSGSQYPTTGLSCLASSTISALVSITTERWRTGAETVPWKAEAPE